MAAPLSVSLPSTMPSNLLDDFEPKGKRKGSDPTESLKPPKAPRLGPLNPTQLQIDRVVPLKTQIEVLQMAEQTEQKGAQAVEDLSRKILITNFSLDT